jgi:putative membrane protein
MPDDSPKGGNATEQRGEFAHLSDHLANERTYLAYLRTAVSLMSFGIAINRFSIFLESSNKMPSGTHLGGSAEIGIGMVFLGMVLLAWAAVRYIMVLRQIELQDFRPRPRGILILTTLVLVFGLGGIGWLFIG